MQSYVMYGLQSGTQERMLILHIMLPLWLSGMRSTAHRRPKVVADLSHVVCTYVVSALMQGANLWYSLHNRCIQQDTLNIIAWPNSR